MGVCWIAATLSFGAVGQAGAQVGADGSRDPGQAEQSVGEFTVWLYDRLIQSADPSVELPPEAIERAEQFWAYVWDGLDPESQALIGQVDLFWPAAATNWYESEPEQQRQILVNIANLVSAVWGEQVVATASFLAGEISYDEYVPYMDALQLAWANAAEPYEDLGGGASQPQSHESESSESEWTIHDVVSTHLGNFIEY
jgi:hypothetical protein